MYQQSPIRAARRIATSALAPIQIGGVGFCNGLTVQFASSSSKCEPFIVDEILGPQPPHRFEPFLEALAETGARHAERLELDIAIADAAAEHEFAARHDVQCRELLGEIERLVQRQQHEAADQPQPRRDRRRNSRETGSAARYSNGCAL